MLFGLQGEGIHVDAGIGSTGVVLEGLNNVEVRAFTLGEAVLAVKLELSGDDRVLTPAVHVEGSLGEDETGGIRNTGGHGSTKDVVFGTVRVSDGGGSGAINEETSAIDETITVGSARTSESMDGVGESIDGIGVVEGLSTESLVENRATS